MAVAGLLAQYLAIKAQISEYEVQNTRWNDLATAMAKKLSGQENLQTKWDSASGTIDEKWHAESGGDLSYGEDTFMIGGSGYGKYSRCDKEEIARSYANRKVPNYDPDKLEEYTALDIEYSTMTSMYETLLDELNAEADGLKEKLGTEAQDTHQLS